MATKKLGIMIGGTEYKSREHAGKSLIFGILGVLGIAVTVLGFILFIFSVVGAVITILVGTLLTYYGFKKLNEQKVGER